jgi:hypothetical protein
VIRGVERSNGDLVTLLGEGFEFRATAVKVEEEARKARAKFFKSNGNLDEDSSDLVVCLGNLAVRISAKELRAAQSRSGSGSGSGGDDESDDETQDNEAEGEVEGTSSGKCGHNDQHQHHREDHQNEGNDLTAPIVRNCEGEEEEEMGDDEEEDEEVEDDGAEPERPSIDDGNHEDVDDFDEIRDGGERAFNVRKKQKTEMW